MLKITIQISHTISGILDTGNYFNKTFLINLIYN